MMKNIFAKSLLLGSLAVGLNAEFLRDDAKNIVTDNKTGLMWQDDAIGNQVDWNTAITTCENLTLGGYDDWRLPNIRELKSIVDKSRFNPAISPNFIIASSYIWSSTTYVAYPDYAWFVYFGMSGDDGAFDKTNNNYVRCVRAGQ